MRDTHWSMSTLNAIFHWFLHQFKEDATILSNALPKVNMSKYQFSMNLLTKNEVIICLNYTGKGSKAKEYLIRIDISDAKFDFLRKHMMTQQLVGDWAGGYWVRYTSEYTSELLNISSVLSYCNRAEVIFVNGAITRKGAMIVCFVPEEECFKTMSIPFEDLIEIKKEIVDDALDFHSELNDFFEEKDILENVLYNVDVHNTNINKKKTEELIDKYLKNSE